MANRKAPTNTTELAMKDPVALLLIAIDESLDLDALGQKEVVYHDVLPVDIICQAQFNGKEILEAGGIKFFEIVPKDKIFQFVELPEGWQKVRTPNHLWSWLLDSKGRKRAAIFYSSSPCERVAHMRLYTRFMVAKDEQKDLEEDLAVANVTDGDKVIYSTEPTPLSNEGLVQYNQIVAAKEAASRWLDANYPDWRNPGAYWD